MTRINSAISVKNLTDEHLLAEHREIKRLPYCLDKAIKLYDIENNIPDKFCLGSGHVSFFFNKMLFIKKRYIEIYNECIYRGFNVKSYLDNFRDIDEKYMNNYNPTREEYKLLFDRIMDRILNSKKEYFHYNHKKIDKTEAMTLLCTPEFLLD